MKNVEVKIYNTSKNQLPKYESLNAAGFDIRADFSGKNKMEDFSGNGNFIFDDLKKEITLFSRGGRVLIPTGIYIGLPDNYELQVRPRSGLALKYGISIVNSPGTIDSDYKGEIGLILINTDPQNDFVIEDGFRCAQGVLKACEQLEWVEVETHEELGQSERGVGGFGHTGNK